MAEPAENILQLPARPKEDPSVGVERATVPRVASAISPQQNVVDRLSARIERLDQAVRRHADVVGRIAGLREAHRTQVAEWLARGQVGRRPEPDPSLGHLESELPALCEDAAAAQAALPAAHQEMNIAAEKLARARTAHAMACYSAAVKIAEEHGARLVNRLEDALLLAAQLDDLGAALLRLGNRPNEEAAPHARSAAAQIRDIIAKAKSSARTLPAPGSGEALLNRLLAGDATADFEPIPAQG